MKLLGILFSIGIIAIIAACASAPQQPALGDWNFDFDTPQGPGDALVTIANDGTGLFASGLLGDVPLSNLAIDGNSIAFSLENTLAGEFNTPIGVIPVTGTRAD